MRRFRSTISFDTLPDYPAIHFFSALPVHVQRDARRDYRLFSSNPAHPGLQFKKLAGEDDINSARIGLDYRALAVKKQDRVIWYWIGSHSAYDRLV